MRITGSSKANFELRPVTYNIGCISPDTIQEIGGDLLFLSPDGIRPIQATERIDDIELATVSRSIQPLVSLITSAANICSVVVREKNQYRIFYHSLTKDEPNCQGVLGSLLNLETSWEWAELLGIKPFMADSSYIGSTEVVIHAGYDGFVYQQEQGNSFDGSNIIATFKTNPIFADDPGLRKTIYKLTTYYRIEGNFTLFAKLVYDFNDALTVQPDAFTLTQPAGAAVFGSAVFGSAVFGSFETPLATKNVHGSGNTVQVHYTSNAMDSPITIQGFKLEYGLYGRR